MKRFGLPVVLVTVAILLSATSAVAATELTRYHCDASFNCAVGAEFDAWWPCEADWSSWGTTSAYKEIIENWDDCEEGPVYRSCWVLDCGVWVQVNCP